MNDVTEEHMRQLGIERLRKIEAAARALTNELTKDGQDQSDEDCVGCGVWPKDGALVHDEWCPFVKLMEALK